MHFDLHFIENIAKNHTEKLATLPLNFSIVTWGYKMEASGYLQTVDCLPVLQNKNYSPCIQRK